MLFRSYRSYTKLNDTILTPQYNDIYTNLRNQIKNALIGYYTKIINGQIATNTYNASFTSVGNAKTNSDKVAILISIKAKLDNLDTIFNTDVAEYMDQIIEPNNKGAKVGNNEISAFQNDIQQKINAQSQLLNAMIENIRDVTKKDIEELKISVADLVTQITAKINAFKGIHSTYFNQSTTDVLANLTAVGISLNVPYSNSNTKQNNEMTAIIRKLAETATKVGNETIPAQVNQNAPSQNAQQVNAPALTGNNQTQGLNTPMNLTSPFPKGTNIEWRPNNNNPKKIYTGKVGSNTMVLGTKNGKMRIPITNILSNQGFPQKQNQQILKNKVKLPGTAGINTESIVGNAVNNSPRNPTNFNQPSK